MRLGHPTKTHIWFLSTLSITMRRRTLTRQSSHLMGGNSMGGIGHEELYAGLPRPAMLPPDTDLVGRSAELESLLNFLATGRLTANRHRESLHVGIYGMPGVGKSALGTKLAYLVEDQYADGALYVDLNTTPVLNGVLDTSQVLRSFLLQLGRNPDQLPKDAIDLPAEFVKATDKKHLIIFLDNVRAFDGVKLLVPRSPTCLVIFTSNRRLYINGLSLHLEPLSDAFSTELFEKIAPNRSANNPEHAEQLGRVLRACDGLPIAIRILAARLEENPGYSLTRLADNLDRHEPQSHLTELVGAERGTIEACFRVSYDALDGEQSTLFRRLSIVPGESFDIALGARLSGSSFHGARLLLEQMRALELIQGTKDPDFFTMHSLWRQFARDQLDDREAKAQLKIALSFYRDQAEDADRTIRSLRPKHDQDWPRSRDQSLDWMEKQHKNLVAAVKRACEENHREIAWQTCRALVEFFEIRGKWESWKQTHEAAAKIVPARSKGIAYLSYGLGRLNGSRRQWDHAIRYYRSAIAVFRQHGDQLQVGRSLNSLGDVYRYMRNWDAAENCFRRSLKILEDANEHRHLAIAMRSMSTIYRQRGQFDQAEDMCRQALHILENESQRAERWIAATKLSLADIYLDSGSHDARGLLEECLLIFEKLEDSHWVILARRSLGEALREENQFDAALEQLNMCLTFLRESQDDHWEGQVLHSLGLVYLAQNDTNRARNLFERALKMFQHSQDTLWEARTQVSIGRAALATGENLPEIQTAFYTAWPLLVEQGARADLAQLEALLHYRPQQGPAADGSIESAP
jgi:tetratricopeptide (TPR) repeat protein